jgi:hypothetical protein
VDELWMSIRKLRVASQKTAAATKRRWRAVSEDDERAQSDTLRGAEAIGRNGKTLSVATVDEAA